MSGIAGISSLSTSDIIAKLQELSRKRTESSGTTSESSQGEASGKAQFDAALDDALSEAGLSSSQIADVKDEIQAAISSAIGSADASSDPREAVAEAVDGVLNKYGVDTDALKEKLQSQASGSRPPGPPPGGGGGGPGDFSSKISDALTASGVEASELEAIQNEIEEAVSAVKEDEEAGAGDPEAVKTAVHQVLDKYGIDQDAFDQEMQSGMAPPSEDSTGGSGSTSLSSILSSLTSSADSTDTYSWLTGLLQVIDEQA